VFITFEGVEGSGKGTALQRTASWLRAQGFSPVLTREPGGSGLGKELRALLLDARNSGISAEAELFLYLADRAQHVRQVIRPALERGLIVLSDRFADSTLVYQGYGRGLDLQILRDLNSLASGGLWPDLTLVLDLDPATGLARARKRNLEAGLEEKEGRFEAESLEFHRKVREGYRDWSGKQPGRIFLIDASGNEEEVFGRIEPFLRRVLRLHSSLPGLGREAV
jgi:dTMP kinase